MKNFNIEWFDFIKGLPSWEKLSFETRELFLNIVRPGIRIDPARMGQHLDLLLETGFFEWTSDNKCLKLRMPFTPFFRMLNVLYLNPLRTDSCLPYLLNHYTQKECFAMNRYKGAVSSSAYYIQRKVETIQWLEPFLNTTKGEQWEDSVLLDSEEPYFCSAKDFKVAQALLRYLMKEKSPIPIRELSSCLGIKDQRLASSTLHACLRYLFVFVWISKKDLEPMVGLWPAIANRQHRPRPKPPQAVKPKETYQSAFQLDDMMSILVASSSSPLRLRVSDGILFANAKKEIVASFQPLPDWVRDGTGMLSEERIGFAQMLLERMGFVQIKHGDKPTLEIPEKGTKWLSVSPKERLLSIFSVLDKWNKTSDGRYNYESIRMIPKTPEIIVDHQVANFWKDIKKAFAQIQGDEFVDGDAFFQFNCIEKNPLLKERTLGKEVVYMAGWDWYHPDDDQLEELWGLCLENFLKFRLVPFGGATIGKVKKNKICFSLTDAGRYLIGTAKDFEYGINEEKQIIVQPNFELVFLTPSPIAEAVLSRFSERIGNNIGVLFKITQKSIFKAASSGMNSADVLAILNDSATKKIPANVEREIKGWMDRCRTIRLQPAILIFCPDAETAGRVLSVGGKSVERVADTIVGLIQPKQKSVILRKLREQGVFLES